MSIKVLRISSRYFKYPSSCSSPENSKKPVSFNLIYKSNEFRNARSISFVEFLIAALTCLLSVTYLLVCCITSRWCCTCARYMFISNCAARCIIAIDCKSLSSSAIIVTFAYGSSLSFLFDTNLWWWLLYIIFSKYSLAFHLCFCIAVYISIA